MCGGAGTLGRGGLLGKSEVAVEVGPPAAGLDIAVARAAVAAAADAGGDVLAGLNVGAPARLPLNNGESRVLGDAEVSAETEGLPLAQVGSARSCVDRGAQVLCQALPGI